ncbi:MAG TPA: lytic murein transglycosylase [Solirubrobacteraceae bacterium]|nr:lytic murein transglycosylase [Solirubrobacteraceae bacterium]
MPTLNRARQRAVRAILSALAGGGLTAAGLAGPLASPALGGGVVGANTGTTTTNATEATGTTTGAEGGQQTTTGTTTTTTPAPTSTAGETTTTATTETTPAPSTTPTSSTPSTQTTSAPAPTTTESAPTPAAEAPRVVLKRKQKASAGTPAPPSTTPTSTNAGGTNAPATSKKATGPNHVAASPQTVAAEAGLLAAMLASSEASTQALSFYRIPLFLLPIYKAAAVQYGVPWQILAAINEIETDYGSDLSVSSAGAVGWMQFMPSTWLQYGVDALNAGYADPYNPVDAVFAAARYLRAAGAATNLRAAIFSYNHSEEYVESVFLRAKLISSYPKDVIATLTGLVDGRVPVTGHKLSWSPVPIPTSTSSSATAGASAVPNAPTAPSATHGEGTQTAAPGSKPAVSPATAAAAATAKKSGSAANPLQLVELLSAPNASVVAVQDGRVVQIGHSRRLGRFLVLRDVYGDVFTYADLGSIASTYVLPKADAAHVSSPVVRDASTPAQTPAQAASAGTQSPQTLELKTPAPKAGAASAGQVSIEAEEQEATPAGMGRPRLFAHPGNPDARAAVSAARARKARASKAGRALPLRTGAVVSTGTVLGRVSLPPGARDGHLRFAIRPAGDPQTVNPGPVLANWAQLQKALHPHGAKASNALLGATASDVFLLSKSQLERAVLSDPGITMDACSRHEVVAGAVNGRVLAVLAFLSRSGLEPTVSGLRCTDRRYAPPGSAFASYTSDELDISAINGTAIAGHQGQESITELTIRTLLSLPSKFVPHAISSLMRFPGAPNTHATASYWNRIHLEFRPPAPATPGLSPAAAATAAHSASNGRTAPAPVVTTSAMSASQWDQLMERVSALPMPNVPSKPTSAAIPDPKRP